MLLIPKDIKDVGGNKLSEREKLVVKEIGQSRCNC